MNRYQMLPQLCNSFATHQLPTLSLADKVSTAAAIFSAIAAIAACYIAYKQSQIARNSYVFSLHEKYFQLMSEASKEKDHFSDKVKQLYANLYEHILWAYSTKRITREDISLFETDFKNPKTVDYINRRRKINREWYKHYNEWLEDNQK